MASWRKKGLSAAKLKELPKARKTRWRNKNRKHYRSYAREWYRLNKDKINAASRARHKRNRLEAFEAYGGKCKCCGESQYEFLVLDHVKGGGNKHRRKLQNSHMFYAWVRRNNYPPVLRVLCNNCNAAIAFYGACPHKNSACRGHLKR